MVLDHLGYRLKSKADCSYMTLWLNFGTERVEPNVSISSHGFPTNYHLIGTL